MLSHVKPPVNQTLTTGYIPPREGLVFTCPLVLRSKVPFTFRSETRIPLDFHYFIPVLTSHEGECEAVLTRSGPKQGPSGVGIGDLVSIRSTGVSEAMKPCSPAIQRSLKSFV